MRQQQPILLTEHRTDTETNVLVGIRMLSRTITDVYDREFRPFAVSAIQYSLLEVIGRMEPVTRAAIARTRHLDKSTLTRDLRSIFAQGWAEEVREQGDGRSRPIALTRAGKQLLLNARSAWFAAQAEAEALLGQDAIVAMIGSVDRSVRSSKASIPGVQLGKQAKRTPRGR